MVWFSFTVMVSSRVRRWSTSRAVRKGSATSTKIQDVVEYGDGGLRAGRQDVVTADRRAGRPHPKGTTEMPELMVDYITSLDGFGAADGWPGLWGMGGPEYYDFLDRDGRDDYLLLM